VQFEVYTNTKLLWDVSYDNSSSDHVFTGRLLTASGSPIGSRNVMISLNETNVVNCTTYANGWFVFRRHFDAGESTITYNVQATFEGTDAHTATLNATAFDGENYTVCTVTYFSFKPSANTTTVTIEPHATEVTVPIQSPEEMQQEAEQSGALTIWHEFNWWYPWYRLHVRISINPIWDIGFNPLLPDEGSGPSFDDIWEFFQGIFEEFAFDFIMGFVKIGGARLVTYLLERYATATPWLLPCLAIGGGFIAFGLLLLDWNNKAALFGGALGALMVMAMTAGWKFAPILVELISYLVPHASLQGLGDVLAGLSQALTAALAVFFRNLADILEVFIGATLLITALTRALTL
jgi:hypothetical protein